jgi:nucleotide-binding universal stress UspA family protein
MRAVLTIKPRSSGDERFNSEAIREAEEDLQRLAEGCSRKGVSAETLTWHDEAGWAILEAAREKHPDLIVMSTHGRSGLGRWLYGSVADRVLRSAEVPIILVPPGAHDDWETAQPFKIVVPVDGSAFAEEAVEPATDLARGLGAEVRLVGAVDPPYYWVGPDAYAVYDPSAESAAARDYAESIAATMSKSGVVASVEISWGPPDRMILNAARELGAHLIVLATHGRGGLARLAMGSVTQAVLHRSAVPLMIVRPAGVRERTREASRAESLALSAEAPLAVLMSAREADVAMRALARLTEDSSLGDDDRRAAEQLLDRLRMVPEVLSAGAAP